MLNSILIVDDDPLQVEIVKDHFERRNIPTIHTAGDGMAAIHLLNETAASPDVIICDLHMPEVDGIELLGHLKNTDCRARIVVVSGSSSTQIAAAAALSDIYGLNIVGTFSKPLDLDALDEALT